MEETKCMVCGKNLASEETICQRCYVDTKTWMPTKKMLPSRWFGIIPGIICISFGIGGMILCHFELALVWLGVSLCALGLFLLLAEYRGCQDDKHRYDLAKTDYQAFLKEMNTLYPHPQGEISEEMKAVLQESSNAYRSRIPACPICGSKSNVRRLGNLDRTVSTAVWGAASSAIGKQWECTACNHKFNVDAAIPSQEQSVKTKHDASQSDPTEELRKYKQLLEDGLITQEDYDQKKKQLLGL